MDWFRHPSSPLGERLDVGAADVLLRSFQARLQGAGAGGTQVGGARCEHPGGCAGEEGGAHSIAGGQDRSGGEKHGKKQVNRLRLR